ncbi:serine/threonine-protein kinase [Nocardia sp. BMG51109]|uniref:serine/threonine-protein kinase n=1 Tax=Nocardia sp. BMG51109 TaxID=1056816 RepID=UPI0012EC30C3|nr:serine/threonine-protein kinase [Nocardia sp. BMG51109]
MLHPGEVFAGYVIERLLGAGGMGEVHVARHPRLPRSDAVKVLAAQFSADAQYRARFEREADLAAQLSHPAIVKVYDRGEDQGRLWIAMELVEGVDLAQRLRADGPVSAFEAARIAETVGGALDRANAQGLVHRDVKPANILLSRAGDILLTDFGIARQITGASDLTDTGAMIGTISYASPEQLSGQPLDGRSDQYSLACSTFHLLTGGAPFADENPGQVILRHCTAAPPSVRASRPELSPEVDRVLARAMAKRPLDRFRSSTEFAAALAAALRLPAGGPEAADPPGGPQAAIPTVVRSTGESARSRQGLWLSAGVVVLVVAIVTAFALWSAGSDEVGPTDAARAVPRVSVTAQSPDLSRRPAGERWRQQSVQGYPIGGTDRVVLYNSGGLGGMLSILDVESGAVLHTVDVGPDAFGECVFTASGRYAGCRARYAESVAGTRDVNLDSYATMIVDTQTGVVSARLPAATEIVAAGETFATFEPEGKGRETGSVTAMDITGKVIWHADGIRAGLVHGAGVLSLEQDAVSGDPFSKAHFELRNIETGKVVYQSNPAHADPGIVWAPDWAAFPGGFAVDKDFYTLDGTKRATAEPGWSVVPSQPYATQGDDPAPNGNDKRYAEPDTAPALPVMIRNDMLGAFDPATGSLLWSRRLPKEASYGRNVSVAGVGSEILVRRDTTAESKYSEYLETKQAVEYVWFDAYTAVGGVLPDEQIPWTTDGSRVVAVPRSGQGTIAVVPAGTNPPPGWSLDFDSSPIRTFAGRVYVGNRRIV